MSYKKEKETHDARKRPRPTRPVAVALSEPDKQRPLGRLAFVENREEVIAYFALPDTMAFARRLGSIKKDLVNKEAPNGAVRYQEFMQLMQRCFEDIVQEETGLRLEWPASSTNHRNKT